MFGALHIVILFFFFSSRRRHTRYWRDWSSDVCSSDLVEQVAAIGLQRVTDVAQRGAVGQHDLPVRAGAGEQLPVQLGTRESPAAQRHDAPVALRNVAEIEWLAEAGLQAVDLAEARIRKLIGHGWFLFDGSLVAAA